MKQGKELSSGGGWGPGCREIVSESFDVVVMLPLERQIYPVRTKLMLARLAGEDDVVRLMTNGDLGCVLFDGQPRVKTG